MFAGESHVHGILLPRLPECLLDGQKFKTYSQKYKRLRATVKRDIEQEGSLIKCEVDKFITLYVILATGKV